MNGKQLKLSGLLVFTLIFLLNSFVIGQSKREKFEVEDYLKKTYSFKADGEIRVNNQHGNITIESWNKNEVEIEAEEYKRGYEPVEIEISVRDGRIDIETIQPRDRFRYNDRKSRVHYLIRVPEKTVIFAESTHGRINIKDIKNDIDVRTTHGRINLENITGEIEAETTHATIVIEDSEGRINAQTTHAQLLLKDVVSDYILGTTTHGRIDAEFTPSSNGKYEFETSHSNIEVYVPEGSKLDVDVRTKLSRFSTDFDLDEFDIPSRNRSSRSRRYDRDDDIDRFSGRLNGGGARLTLETSHGRISLKYK